MIRKFLVGGALALSVFFVACSGDDDGTNPGGGATEGDLSLQGVAYTLVDGFVEDYGDDGTHYNYDFTLVDDEIAVVDGDLIPGEATTIGIYAELFSAGTGSFTPGTFEYLDFFSQPGNEQSYFNFFDLFTFNEPIGTNIEATPDAYYVGVGGTITVTDNGNSNYTIVYNVDVAQADVDSSNLIEDGETFNVSFTFSGDLQFFALDDFAGARLAKNRGAF